MATVSHYLCKLFRKILARFPPLRIYNFYLDTVSEQYLQRRAMERRIADSARNCLPGSLLLSGTPQVTKQTYVTSLILYHRLFVVFSGYMLSRLRYIIIQYTHTILIICAYRSATRNFQGKIMIIIIGIYQIKFTILYGYRDTAQVLNSLVVAILQHLQVLCTLHSWLKYQAWLLHILHTLPH